MDRESLFRWLADGISVERIAKRVGKNPSTVAYWMRKYGLVAPMREKYGAKGGINRDELVAIVEGGMTVADIGQAVGLGKTAVRHWLRRYGLRTRNRVGPRLGSVARDARAAGLASITFECPRHGASEYVLEGRGYYRCKRCRSEGISERRRKMKLRLVAEAGGCCAICGYSRCMSAVAFHHLDPLAKRLP